MVPHDPHCCLCPGNSRAHGVRNPDYTSTFAFTNDFPALVPDVSMRRRSAADARVEAPGFRPLHELFVSTAERGLCRVICFTPRHDLTLASMDVAAIRAVVDTWIDERAAASAYPWVRYALVFENRGEMMGASNPHPHGQLWATESIPGEVVREHQAFLAHGGANGSACLLCEYATAEIDRRERVVCGNEAFVVIVPFWAVWPFETLLVGRRHCGSLGALDPAERHALADILKRLARRYDRLLDAPFPYSMGFHQAPLIADARVWHLHAHFYPPLLRSATIRKFMVGFELLGGPQRDLTPEDAAARLREAGE
jgi:UDPglucose--hexose-1-phosphate uridylyltransferase